jgi:hypothetical protein
MNAGILMDPLYFLNAVYNRGFLNVKVWMTMLDANGTPTDTNNNSYGPHLKTYLLNPEIFKNIFKN